MPDIYTYERECDEIDEIMKNKEKLNELDKIKDWRGVKGKYYDYGFKDGKKKTLKNVKKIIENIFKNYKNRDIDAGRETEALLDLYIDEIKYKIEQEIKKLRSKKE